jgi:haloalkane dehalogenase
MSGPQHPLIDGETGWGPMPYPVIVPPVRAATYAGDAEISPDYPFAARYARVLGSRMHYVEAGAGAPIVLLHGNPTWSYIWRNVIPHLTAHGRCIAPDLIGYGRSDKPPLEYRWADHVRYLEAFMETLGLKDVVLVLHDQGSGLGFHYARRHEANVRAIAFFEALVRPFEWERFSTPEYRGVFRAFRSGGVGGAGWQLLVDRNVFIEDLLPQAAGRALSEEELDYYREPFVRPASRLPIWRFARETPIGGEPPDVWQAAAEYSRWLQRAAIPKLLLYAEPGALLTPEHLAWATGTIHHLATVNIGPGIHFLQESTPHQIGREIARWLVGLRASR